MSPAQKANTAKGSRSAHEIARSFGAGALYMGLVAGTGFGTLAFVSAYAPVVAEKIAPHQFPVYTANKLERVERLTANRWDARPERKDTISRVAIADADAMAVE